MNQDSTQKLANLEIGGIFTCEHIRDGKVIETWEEHNIIPDLALNGIMNVAFVSGSPYTSSFVGIYANNYTPLASNDIATFPSVGVAGEITSEISNVTRPAWTVVTTTTKSLSNTASPAVFTFGANASVNGAFLATTATKGGTTGLLIAASKFATTRAMLSGDVLSIIYTLNIATI